MRYFIVIIGLSCLFSCVKERHHLIEDVGRKITHQDDTIGWSYVLERMHGIWIQQKYIDILQQKKSITDANSLAPSAYTVINIDTRKFMTDSLPFVALNANDSKSFDGCFYFYRKSDGKSFYIDVESRHPIVSSGAIEMTVGLERIGEEQILVIKQQYEGGISDKDRYVRASDDIDVTAKNYLYDPMQGVEIVARRMIAGRYHLYDADNKLLKRNLELREDGTLGNHPFAKYRMLAWTGFDALMIQGLPVVEEQIQPNDAYFGLKIVDGDLELYEIVKDKKNQIIMGNRLFTLRRR